VPTKDNYAQWLEGFEQNSQTFDDDSGNDDALQTAFTLRRTPTGRDASAKLVADNRQTPVRTGSARAESARKGSARKGEAQEGLEPPPTTDDILDDNTLGDDPLEKALQDDTRGARAPGTDEPREQPDTIGDNADDPEAPVDDVFAEAYQTLRDDPEVYDDIGSGVGSEVDRFEDDFEEDNDYDLHEGTHTTHESDADGTPNTSPRARTSKRRINLVDGIVTAYLVIMAVWLFREMFLS
jgi:hypothetical protein